MNALGDVLAENTKALWDDMRHLPSLQSCLFFTLTDKGWCCLITQNPCQGGRDTGQHLHWRKLEKLTEKCWEIMGLKTMGLLPAVTGRLNKQRIACCSFSKLKLSAALISCFTDQSLENSCHWGLGLPVFTTGLLSTSGPRFHLHLSGFISYVSQGSTLNVRFTIYFLNAFLFYTFRQLWFTFTGL